MNEMFPLIRLGLFDWGLSLVTDNAAAVEVSFPLSHNRFPEFEMLIPCLLLIQC